MGQDLSEVDEQPAAGFPQQHSRHPLHRQLRESAMSVTAMPVAAKSVAITADTMIAMRGVNKWYGTYQVLTDINLAVRASEKIVLCGPSGSGKSTLIRCINALESYQKGEIVVDGVHLGSQGKAIDAVRREVGMVFQQFN